MERNIQIRLEEARKWFNSGNKYLKEIALQAFNENELKYDFRSITTFEKACEALNLDYNDIKSTITHIIISSYSNSSVAMFKLNIINWALNLGYNLQLTENPKDSYIYYPYNPFADESSNYVDKFNADKPSKKLRKIGKIKNKGVLYNVLGGAAVLSSGKGVACFCSGSKVGYGYFDSGFLGCATEEIAEHFSRYFGMLITEAKYGDLEGVEIMNIN